eukprot:s632_g10.t1
MTKEEVEEAENTPLEGDEKADDDEMKDEEPSDEVKMETDEVNVDDQFEEVHRDLGSFSFNEEEVDYDDDEDEEEEMEVEEEAEEPKMSPNDENVHTAVGIVRLMSRWANTSHSLQAIKEVTEDGLFFYLLGSPAIPALGSDWVMASITDPQ